MNAHFFNPKDPILVIACLATLKLACDTNYIHETAAMWLLTHFVLEMLIIVLNRRIYAKNRLATLVALVHNQKPRFRQLLRSYPEVINLLLKTFYTDR